MVLPNKYDEAAELAVLVAIIEAFVASYGTPTRYGPTVPGDIMSTAAASMPAGYSKDSMGQHYRRQIRPRQFSVGAPGNPNQFRDPNAAVASTTSTPSTTAKAGSKRKRGNITINIKNEDEDSDREATPPDTKDMGPNVNYKKKDDDPDNGGGGTGGNTGLTGNGGDSGMASTGGAGIAAS